MAWDSKPSRRRQSSAASGTRNLAIHARAQARQPVHAKSPHVADPFLQDFLSPSFDAASYLNSTLPSLQTPGMSASAKSSQGAVPLADLSIQAQSSLSQLNAHTTRLTNTLTQLTDDILRSGGRLAYEVELLRGETLSLAETLSEGLEEDISQFVPGGVKEAILDPRTVSTSSAMTDSLGGTTPAHARRLSVATPSAAAAAAAAAGAANTTSTPSNEPPPAAAGTQDGEPPYITQLRTLTLVRSRLDSVIKTFGEAMEFVFPPSEVSVSSSFLSVSAPDAGGANHSTEEKGQQVLQSLREEISLLLNNSSSDPIKGIEDAARRIEELKDLAQVWKGTAEERGRTKFIEGLAKMVEDRHERLLREMESSSSGGGGGNTRRSEAEKRSSVPSENGGEGENKGYGGYGFISQLHKLRSGAI
ncbi:hypothetical protein QBC35DRAFT_491772 [Podospora australis]|uniref:Uncharacterized protein n=1 Tax=Podospora australis TaxID=1536484 RepID=A0AAN7ALN9_9PEZI|nr:hypothetical protein QBC35DRAFT_491772 [Podospora australis]